MEEPNSTPTSDKFSLSHRLALLTLTVALAIFLLSIRPLEGRWVDDFMRSLSFRSVYGWQLAQSLLVTVPFYFLGIALGAWRPRFGFTVSSICLFLVPLVLLLDELSARSIGERFLSSYTVKIFTSMLPSLIIYVTQEVVLKFLVLFVTYACFVVALLYISRKLCHKWMDRPATAQPTAVMFLTLFLAIGLSIPTMRNRVPVFSDMGTYPVRNPLCALLIVPAKTAILPHPVGQELIDAKLRGLNMAPSAYAKLDQFNSIRLEQGEIDGSELEGVDSDDSVAAPPDIVIVVAESLRPEVLDKAVTPNLSELAERSIVCTNHLSTGNTTKLGLFGLMYGIEAVWYELFCHEKPPLNKLFDAKGYEIGFFACKIDDWVLHDMTGYIGPDNFDVFSESDGEWPISDVKATKEATEFLTRTGFYATPKGRKRKPRLTFLYYFSTHIRYFAEPQDEVFKPAAGSRFAVPFTHAERPAIYNQYKNSVRTFDRLIAPLIKDNNQVTIVLGDHGEAFLEDDTMIHGTRLSEVQLATPVVIHFPGVQPREVKGPTCHTDVLPTLIAGMKLNVSGIEQLEGMNLLETSDDLLMQRTLSVRDLMSRNLGIAGPWTFGNRQPYLYCGLMSLGEWTAAPLNPVDDRGLRINDPELQAKNDRVFTDWLLARFGAESIDKQSTTIELIEKHARSSLADIRQRTMVIAETLPKPTERLLRVVKDLTLDKDDKVRQTAIDTLLVLQRRYDSLK